MIFFGNASVPAVPLGIQIEPYHIDSRHILAYFHRRLPARFLWRLAMADAGKAGISAE
jgi:hypothetical protein